MLRRRFRFRDFVLSGLCLTLVAGCAGAGVPDTPTALATSGSAMQIKTIDRTGGLLAEDAGLTRLAQTHAQALRDAAGTDRDPDISLNVGLGFARTDAEVAWPPGPVGAAALVSPWMILERGAPSGPVEVTVLTTDMRVAMDRYLVAADAAPSRYAVDGPLPVIGADCMQAATAQYAETVQAGETPGTGIFEDTCVDGPWRDAMLHLFTTAKQNFYLPFGRSVSARIDANRAGTADFYAPLYDALLTEGLAQLETPDQQGGSGIWWQKALRAATGGD